LDKILKTRGVSYHLIKDDERPELLQIGFIAQELQLVFPELVYEDPETTMLSIRFETIISACLEAIKEQSTLLDFHERKLEKLEMLASGKKGI
jgi:hypothetical protein